MTRHTLIRKNQSFLRNVFQIGKQLNPDFSIETDAMLEIFHSLEKLMIQHVQSATQLCRIHKKKKLSANYIRRVSQSFIILMQTSFPPSLHSTNEEVGEDDQKQIRILEIREQLRVIEKEEKRQECLKRICKYKREMRKRMREKEKRTKKMIRSLKFIF